MITSPPPHIVTEDIQLPAEASLPSPIHCLTAELSMLLSKRRIQIFIAPWPKLHTVALSEPFLSKKAKPPINLPHRATHMPYKHCSGSKFDLTKVTRHIPFHIEGFTGV